ISLKTLVGSSSFLYLLENKTSSILRIRWMLLPKPSPILPFFGGQALGKLWIKNILFCSLKNAV
ncbi:TPA: hypothetical protein ACKUIT_002175, partial [Neisseria gonorrhoeae]